MTYENCYQILKCLGYSYEYVQDTTDGTLWYIIQQPHPYNKQHLKIPNVGNNLGMIVASLLFAHKKYFALLDDGSVEIKSLYESSRWQHRISKREWKTQEYGEELLTRMPGEIWVLAGRVVSDMEYDMDNDQDLMRIQ